MKKAEWIWLTNEPKPNEYVAFQDTLVLEQDEKCKMFISVAGDYNLFINGEFIDFGQYPDFSHYKVYDEIDIGNYLKKGKNEIRIIAWYIGKSFSSCKNFGAGLIYEMQNGNGDILAYSKVGTCASLAQGYVSHHNKTITPQLGLSYKYDTRVSRYEWTSAKKVEGFGKDLIKRPNAKLRLGNFKQANLIDAKKKLYDLGEESCGFLSIKFKARNGETLKIGFGEHIADGSVRHYINGRDFTVELIGNGEWVEVLGSFRRLGCRYLQIVEGDAQIEYIGLRETNYPFTVKEYSIKEKRQNRIYEIALKTLQLCFHEHYEDCPWREQSMYIMDSRNQMLCSYYAFDNIECAQSSIRLIGEGQKENGLFELCFPADVPITIPSFSLAFTKMVLEYVNFSNDICMCKDMLPKIEKMLDFFLVRMDKNGLFKTVDEEGIWHFYEWAKGLDGSSIMIDGIKKKRDEYDVLINAFLLLALQDTVHLLTLLGDELKTDRYRKIAENLRSNIYKQFFVAETGLFKTYNDNRDGNSELANALCVLTDCCDKKEARFICDKLSANYNGWIRNTLSMSIFKYDALLKTDKEKYGAYILQDINETYGYMLDCGATSFWETIKGETDFNLAGSLCHGWSALPIYYYWRLGVI